MAHRTSEVDVDSIHLGSLRLMQHTRNPMITKPRLGQSRQPIADLPTEGHVYGVPGEKNPLHAGDVMGASKRLGVEEEVGRLRSTYGRTTNELLLKRMQQTLTGTTVRRGYRLPSDRDPGYVYGRKGGAVEDTAAILTLQGQKDYLQGQLDKERRVRRAAAEERRARGIHGAQGARPTKASTGHSILSRKVEEKKRFTMRRFKGVEGRTSQAWRGAKGATGGQQQQDVAEQVPSQKEEEDVAE